MPCLCEATITHEVHMGGQRSWGYEIPTTFIDDATGAEHNIVMVFPKLPTAKEQTTMLLFWVAKIEAMETELELDEMISKKEVEQLLIDKGYLEAGQKLEDLSPKGVAK